MWRDIDGRIVTKKPAIARDALKSRSHVQSQHVNPVHTLKGYPALSNQGKVTPTTPSQVNDVSVPPSLETQIPSSLPTYLPSTRSLNNPPGQIASSVEYPIWPTTLPQVEPDSSDTTAIDHPPLAGIFNPALSSSLNYSFTTISDCYSLFDMMRRQVRWTT